MKWFKKLRDINPDSLAKHAPYLAGLLDGEGTFAIRMINNDHLLFFPMIEIGMSHEKTIEFVADIFGIDRSRKSKREKPHKDMYYIRVTTQAEIEQIAEALRPYSITRQEQIQLILEFFSLKRTFPGGKYDSKSRAILLKMVDVYIEVRKRNERGPPPDYESMRKRLKSKVEKEFEFVK